MCLTYSPTDMNRPVQALVMVFFLAICDTPTFVEDCSVDEDVKEHVFLPVKGKGSDPEKLNVRSKRLEK